MSVDPLGGYVELKSHNIFNGYGEAKFWVSKLIIMPCMDFNSTISWGIGEGSPPVAQRSLIGSRQFPQVGGVRPITLQYVVALHPLKLVADVTL